MAKPVSPQTHRFPPSWLFTAAVPLLAVIAIAFYRMRAGCGYPLDDTWIHLAFARDLAHGSGFSVNPGELSTGSTSPLWAVLLALGYWVGFDHSVWPWILGTICLGAAGLACSLVAARIQEPRFAIKQLRSWSASQWVGLLVVCTGPLIWSGAGAMETPLFVALLMLAWAQQLKDNSAPPVFPKWGFPAGLAALARPEGLLFALLLALASKRRIALTGLLSAALTFAPYSLYCLIASGLPFPSTFYAKTTRTLAGLPDLDYVVDALGLMFRTNPALSLLFAFGLALAAIRALARQPRPKRVKPSAGVKPLSSFSARLLPGILFVFLLPVAYSAMGRTFLFAGLAGNFGRYLFPLVPFLPVAGVTLIRSHWRVGRVAQQGVFATVLAWNLIAGFGFASFFAHNVRDVNAIQVEMARRLQRQLPDRATVAANDVGALAYFTSFKVVDLVGIISPDVQRALFPLRRSSSASRQQALLGLMTTLKPEAWIVFPRWYPEMMKTLAPRLRLIERIRVADNITAAQDELDAYAIDWSEGGLSEMPRAR